MNYLPNYLFYLFNIFKSCLEKPLGNFYYLCSFISKICMKIPETDPKVLEFSPFILLKKYFYNTRT